MKSEIKKQMDKVINFLESEFIQLQIGRASSWLVENINIFIPHYWMEQKLNQLANISIIDNQTIKIEPWDKSTISAIEKSTRDANLWFNPLNQGDYILIKIPPLTEERRKQLTKLVNKMWEDAKISIRNIRHDFKKQIENQYKNEEISEDEKKQLEKQLDEITKEYTQKIDQLVEAKNEEIMKI